MDKIWDRNPSKFKLFGRCGGDEKTNDHAEPTKSRTLKKKVHETFSMDPYATLAVLCR